MKKVKQQKLPRNLLVLNPILRKGGRHKQKPDAKSDATRQELKDFSRC